MNHELGRVWKEFVVSYINLVANNLPWGSEEYHETAVSLAYLGAEIRKWDRHVYEDPLNRGFRTHSRGFSSV